MDVAWGFLLGSRSLTVELGFHGTEMPRTDQGEVRPPSSPLLGVMERARTLRVLGVLPAPLPAS